MGWLTSSSIGYGLVNVIFGIIGYINAKSIPSLIAGVAAGIIVLIGATLSKTHRRQGFLIVMVVSVLILGRFFKPAFMEGKIYPAMILAVLSILMLGLLAVGHFMDRKPQPDTVA